MQVHVHDSLAAIDATDWNRLNRNGNPFLRHEFLLALEQTGCLGEQHGWFPRYFTLGNDGQLLGACPAYIKTNSYGEFVFDWSWAEAYEEHGLRYYPKLVVAVPYTPVTGQRLLTAPEADRELIAGLLIRAVHEYADAGKLSGVHWLFPTDDERELLAGTDHTALRNDCQYHWYNRDYSSFDDFLADCTAKRRKTIKRERRSVAEQDLQLEVRSGDSLSEAEWSVVCALYASTFDRKWGEASLSEAFFQQVGRTMGENFVIVFARDEQGIAACAVMLRDEETLYGRYWGCFRQYRNLHFEACFYQGIDYCIEHKLKRFEPGAQGEHKITRGFHPTLTWSAHRLFDEGFNEAVGRYLTQERAMVEKRREQLGTLLPFNEHYPAS
ncbi:GNAT family N-acetyltransferase [Granulosicoccaceae sp. 1_MG-2023]|nr:GNAT family N-acetyltransferase [Granulosicoccaceae sp. 1_MG-2023]